MIARVTVCASFSPTTSERVTWQSIESASLEEAIKQAMERTKAAFIVSQYREASMRLTCEKAEAIR